MFFDVAIGIVIVSVILGLIFSDSLPLTSRFVAFWEVFFASLSLLSVTTLLLSMTYVQLGSEALLFAFAFLFALILAFNFAARLFG